MCIDIRFKIPSYFMSVVVETNDKPAGQNLFLRAKRWNNLGPRSTVFVLVHCRDCVTENDWCWRNLEYLFCRVIYLNVLACALGDTIKIFACLLKATFWFWLALYMNTTKYVLILSEKYYKGLVSHQNNIDWNITKFWRVLSVKH